MCDAVDANDLNNIAEEYKKSLAQQHVRHLYFDLSNMESTQCIVLTKNRSGKLDIAKNKKIAHTKVHAFPFD